MVNANGKVIEATRDEKNLKLCATSTKHGRT